MSIIVENLHKTYNTQHALKNINFQIKTGEIVGFLGPNGAGKSTTMKIATGYLPATSGTIQVCGVSVQENPLAVRKNIGYLPEHNPLYLDMYVKEYLAFVGEMYKMNGKILKDSINNLIDICGLEREQQKKIGALSKGYRQRVGLAQALIHNPPVLILDEPTTGLDPNQIIEIRQLIKNIGKEKTVVFSTHIMQEVEAICSRAIIINLGEIVADNSIAELQKNAQNKKIISLETDKSVDVEIFKTLENVLLVENNSPTKFQIHTNADIDARQSIAQAVTQAGAFVIAMQVQERSLEDVFRNLTK